MGRDRGQIQTQYYDHVTPQSWGIFLPILNSLPVRFDRLTNFDKPPIPGSCQLVDLTRFFRANRQCIVTLDAIVGYRPHNGQKLRVLLRNRTANLNSSSVKKKRGHFGTGWKDSSTNHLVSSRLYCFNSFLIVSCGRAGTKLSLIPVMSLAATSAFRMASSVA